MAVPKEEDVKRVLADFEIRLRRVVDGAWSEWLEVPFRSRLVFADRARAVLVFDFIARRALTEFEGDKNIRTIKKKQTLQFLFKDQVIARFKKGNAKGIGSNIVTQQVLNFIDPQRNIPGLIPDIMKVEICYSPDLLGIGLDEVAVVARDVTSRLWAFELNRGVPEAEVIPLPTRPPDTTPPVVLPRQPKTDETSETEE